MQIAKSYSHEFAGSSTFIPILITEIFEVSHELPLVFIPIAKEEYILVAITGLKKGLNSMIKNGVWQGKYVPAFIRRYPFITIGKPDDPKQFMLAIDAQADCLSSKVTKAAVEKYTPLFEAEQPGQKLREILPFLQSYHTDNLASVDFFRKLKDLGLLSKSDLSVQGDDQKKYQINNVFLIDEKKLNSLDSDVIYSLFKDNALAKIYFIQSSLRNFPALSKKLRNLDGDAGHLEAKSEAIAPKKPAKVKVATAKKISSNKKTTSSSDA